MNRTFLIFLMIGTAMMIAVIGQYKPDPALDYKPWEIDLLDNGATRVFGITLQKTTIQEANQIYANFAKTELIATPLSDGTTDLKLIASYSDLITGGIVADLQLQYDIDKEIKQKLYQQAVQEPPSISTTSESQVITLSADTEMNFLNTPVHSVTYTPSIDFGEELIRQYFGRAEEETTIDELTRRWFYPQLGLEIFIIQNQPDRFIYSPIN